MSTISKRVKGIFYIEILFYANTRHQRIKSSALVCVSTSKSLFLTSNSMSYFWDSQRYMRSKYSLQICFSWSKNTRQYLKLSSYKNTQYQSHSSGLKKKLNLKLSKPYFMIQVFYGQQIKQFLESRKLSCVNLLSL